MDINEFIEKVKELGYDAEHRILGNDPLNDAVVVSEDDYYYVSIHPPNIFDTPFEVIIGEVREELKRLKENE